MSLFEYMLPLAFVGALSGSGPNGLMEFNKHMMNYLKMMQAEENKNKENAAKREKEQGDDPSPKRMKLDESNDVITSEDESHDKEDVKSVKGILILNYFKNYNYGRKTTIPWLYNESITGSSNYRVTRRCVSQKVQIWAPCH